MSTVALVPSAPGLGKHAHGFSLDKGQVAVEDHYRARCNVASPKRYAHGVPGAQALRLLDGFYLHGRLRVRLVKNRADLVRVAAHYNNDALAPCLDGCVDDPPDQRFCKILCDHLYAWFDFMRVPSPAARMIAVAFMHAPD